jgi:hypothetical protein
MKRSLPTFRRLHKIFSNERHLKKTYVELDTFEDFCKETYSAPWLNSLKETYPDVYDRALAILEYEINLLELKYSKPAKTEEVILPAPPQSSAAFTPEQLDDLLDNSELLYGSESPQAT